MDRPGMTLVEQRDRRIDHSETGADHQHRALRVELGEGVGRPRVGAIEIGVVEAGVGQRRRFRRKVADREHGDIGTQRAATVEMEDDLVAVMFDPLGVAAQQLEIDRLRRSLDLLVQQMADVIAENLPGHETALGYRTGDRQVGLRFEPFDEIVRPVMEGAHLAGRDIEQVAGIAGGVGGAAPELNAAFDQCELRSGRTSPQQVKREQRAAEPRADDRNPCHQPSRLENLNLQDPSEEGFLPAPVPLSQTDSSIWRGSGVLQGSTRLRVKLIRRELPRRPVSGLICRAESALQYGRRRHRHRR